MRGRDVFEMKLYNLFISEAETGIREVVYQGKQIMEVVV